MLRPRSTLTLAATLVALSAFAGPTSADAQSILCRICSLRSDVVDVAYRPVQEVEARTRGPWWTLWSKQTPHDRIISAMLTAHIYELDEGLTNNWAIGIVERGFVGATFITTHGPRGFVLAVERSWLEGELGPTKTMLGFRTGLVYGYDRRLFKLADYTPILPYGQPVALIRAGPVSADLTYTWVVFSFTFGLSVR